MSKTSLLSDLVLAYVKQEFSDNVSGPEGIVQLQKGLKQKGNSAHYGANTSKVRNKKTARDLWGGKNIMQTFKRPDIRRHVTNLT